MTTPSDSTPIEARVLREREWVYEAWLARLTFTQIRTLANAAPADGGLGYDLAITAIKGLIEQAKADRGETTMGKAERAERRQAERDELARHARARLREAAAKQGADDDAAKLLLTVHKAEREEFGDDAASRHEVEVTNRSAVDAELEAMLARLDPPKKQHSK